MHPTNAGLNFVISDLEIEPNALQTGTKKGRKDRIGQSPITQFKRMSDRYQKTLPAERKKAVRSLTTAQPFLYSISGEVGARFRGLRFS